MKKSLFSTLASVLICLGIISLSSVSNLYADCAVFPSNCTCTPWQTGETNLGGFVEARLGPTCKIWVKYDVRTCQCDGGITYNEVHIYGIEKVGSGCASIPDADIINAAEKAILVNASTIFATTGTMNVRISIPNCYEWLGGSTMNFSEGAACDCCTWEYNISPDGSGVVVNSASQITTTPTCSLINLCHPIQTCPQISIPTGPIYTSDVDGYYGDCGTTEPSCTANKWYSLPFTAYQGKLGPDCNFYVYFEARVCQNTNPYTYFLRIKKITMDGCPGYTTEQIYAKAVKRLLYHAYEIFGPYANLRINFLTQPCWQRVAVPYNKEAMYPCDYGTCCTWIYDVNTSDRTLIGIPLQSTQPTCTYPAPCKYVCNDNTLRFASSFPYALPDRNNIALRQVNAEEGNAQQPVQKLNTSFVVPNPANEKIDVYLQSADKGSATLIVSDMRGSEVVKVNFNKSAYESVYALDTKNFTNGLYTYQIILEGNITAKGKFVVSH